MKRTMLISLVDQALNSAFNLLLNLAFIAFATPAEFGRFAFVLAGSFFAAYGPPLSDTEASGGTTLYKWRGGFAKGKSCTVELTVNEAYKINSIRAVADHPDPKGGPSHCEKVLDAAK